MKVLFSVRSFWSVKVYESAIRALAERGHSVALVATGGRAGRKREWEAAARRLATESPGVTVEYMPKAPDALQRLSRALRYGIDFLRYLDPAYASTPKLRERAAPLAPALVRRLAAAPVLRTGPGLRVLRRVLGAVDAALAEPPVVGELIDRHDPDVVLISPLVTLGSPQLDVLRAACRLGRRSALAVGSWDHLSSKALIRLQPDRVLVWNNVQRREAVEQHGIPSARVVATGAQCFDQWFGRAPGRAREEFCRRVGLPDAAPFVAYVCSSLFAGSPPEAGFVERWLEALRASPDPRVRECRILIRPHPNRTDEWQGHPLASHPGVALWPATSVAPIDEAGKDDYFDTLHHAAAVVGLNTSAMIEAAIVGRPVLTVLLPEFQENQEGTLHFHYLLQVGGGILQAARTLPEHASQLGAALAGQTPRHDRFVREFVRPQGLDRPATPAFVDALEALAHEPAPRPHRGLRLAFAVRPLALRLAGLAGG